MSNGNLFSPQEMTLLFLNSLIDIRTELAWLTVAVACVAAATLVAAWVLYRNGQGSREMAKAVAKAQREQALVKRSQRVGEVVTSFRG